MSRFEKAIKTLVKDYGWIHLGVGLAGNTLFVMGSVAFLPSLETVHVPWRSAPMEWQTVGVWLFIIGASLMFFGSLGSLLVSIYTDRHGRP